jgi:5-formyltetrahydrofolate cyclo-ligase
VSSPAKLALRDQLVTARNRLSVQELGEHSAKLAEQTMGMPEVRQAATLAGYVSVAQEPGTAHLLAALEAAGKRVILPILQSDFELDWAVYEGPSRLVSARFGLLEPLGPRLGRDAIAQTDLALVPGLGVSLSGERLGRGGGCYDRALSNLAAGTPTFVLLYDHEVGIQIPVEPHDQIVTGAISPHKVTRFPTPGGPIVLG